MKPRTWISLDGEDRLRITDKSDLDKGRVVELELLRDGVPIGGVDLGLGVATALHDWLTGWLEERQALDG